MATTPTLHRVKGLARLLGRIAPASWQEHPLRHTKQGSAQPWTSRRTRRQDQTGRLGVQAWRPVLGVKGPFSPAPAFTHPRFFPLPPLDPRTKRARCASRGNSPNRSSSCRLRGRSAFLPCPLSLVPFLYLTPSQYSLAIPFLVLSDCLPPPLGKSYTSSPAHHHAYRFSWAILGPMPGILLGGTQLRCVLCGLCSLHAVCGLQPSPLFRRLDCVLGHGVSS